MNDGKPHPEPIFLVPPGPDDEPLAAQIARALNERRPAPDSLPLLTDVAQGDPYLAEQLAALHAMWEIQPQPPRGALDRLRRRIAWWLLEPELRQINAVHATLHPPDRQPDRAGGSRARSATTNRRAHILTQVNENLTRTLQPACLITSTCTLESQLPREVRNLSTHPSKSQGHLF